MTSERDSTPPYPSSVFKNSSAAAADTTAVVAKPGPDATTKTSSTSSSAVKIACKIMQQRGLSPRPAATAASYQQPNLVDKTTWLPPRPQTTSSLKESVLIKRKSLFAAAAKSKGGKNNSSSSAFSIPRPSLKLPHTDTEEETKNISKTIENHEEKEGRDGDELTPPPPAMSSSNSNATTTPKIEKSPKKSPRKLVYQKQQQSLPPPPPTTPVLNEEENKDDDGGCVGGGGGNVGDLPSPSVARSPPPLKHQQQHQQQQQVYSLATSDGQTSASSYVHMVAPKKNKIIPAANPFCKSQQQQQQGSSSSHFLFSSCSSSVSPPHEKYEDELIELRIAGLTPYRNVSFVETGECFVLCVTPLGDRVAIHYSQQEATQRSHSLNQIPSDYLNGVFLTNEEDAREIGVEKLVASTGIAAGVANTGFHMPISGIISASTPQEGLLPVYSIISFTAGGSSSSSSTTKSSGAVDRGVPTFLILSDRKLFSSHSIFGNDHVIRSFGVAPIVKLPQLLKQTQTSSDSITKIVRCATASIEKQHFSFSGKELSKSIKDSVKKISDFTSTFNNMSELVAEAREAETKALAIERMKCMSSSSSSSSSAPKETVLFETGKRLSELSCFASRMEEIFGEASTGVEKGLMNAEKEMKQALADLFVETKLYLPNAKGKINDSRTWGYSSHFNQIDFKILSKKVCNHFINASTATSASTFESLTNNPYTASALEEFPEIVLAVFKANQKN